MAAIDEITLESAPAGHWAAVAGQARAWLDGRGAALRDSVVLLPFAALLPLAREGFARAGGWMPRIETPLTLAATLAPPPVVAAGELCGDAAIDALHAAALLQQQPWAAARAREDRRAFEHIVSLLVDAASALRRGALARAPAERPAFWARAREHCPVAAGPGAFEALLLRVAIEWAERGAGAATDTLFALAPAAWIVVRIGGRDALAEALAPGTGRPGLVIDLDAVPGDAAPERWLCEDREQEAAAAATQVIDALNAGRVPVALVALDRQVVRRVRALLDRQRVAIADETGWALSTTRAAARVMAQLRAVGAPGADARLDWLKGWPPAVAAPRALEALEAAWRGARSVRDRELADALWARAQEHLAPWSARRERALADWLVLLQDRLASDGSLAELRADAAGQQLLQAAGLDRADTAWRAATSALRVDLAGFTAWLDQRLEASPFVPPAAPGAEVVLTPLARAIGRPFAQIVIAGADAEHLGAIEPAAALIGDALAETLGLETRRSRRERQRRAFAQLLHAPALALLRRARDSDEALAASPEVEALALARAIEGRPLPPEWRWLAPQQPVIARRTGRPLPTAPADLPERLSASSIETLRECPYRFFARSVLRLVEFDELEAGVEKRDYGTWLHGVLHRFHRERVPGQDDGVALAAAADAETAEQRLEPAELLPYRAGFEQFAPAYLAWTAQREAAGWRWEGGELERTAEPEALRPQRLQSRLDRLDRAADGSLQVIDYKTGAASKLRDRVADPLEDTQLAVYAALEPRARSAIYLALDDPKAPIVIEHRDVPATAAVLVERVGAEMARLRAGAAMPALGEGTVCDFCEVRGLCRRDHWVPEP